MIPFGLAVLAVTLGVVLGVVLIVWQELQLRRIEREHDEERGEL